MPLYKKEHILEATDSGLEIICHYYPDARDCVGKKGKKFRMRAEEKTPSATIRLHNGSYRVCDFGGDGREIDAISLAMAEENKDFPETLEILAKRYGIASSDGSVKGPSADFSKRPANSEEKEGEYIFDIREKMLDWELKTLGKYVTEKNCRDYNCYSVANYTYIKNREALTFTANESYPIFIFDYVKFKKLYRPKELDKGLRFIYIGEKPKEIIYGLDIAHRLQQEYADKEFERKIAEGKEIDIEDIKLPEIILASGERDALNVASAGLIPVWKNSETALLSHEQFNSLSKIAERIVNIPDIDETGRKEAYKLGLFHIGLFTAWLPEELRTKKDWRGNPCKDTTDMVDHFGTKALRKVVDAAVCFRPWDEIKEYDKNNDLKSIKIEVNNTHTYEFCQANGFWRIEKKTEKTGFAFVKIDGSFVEEVKPSEIKYFIHSWIKKNHLSTKIRNVFYRTTQISEGSLSGNLGVANLNFVSFDRHSQLFYFPNKVVKVTKHGYDATSSANNHVWKDTVLGTNFRKLAPFFEWAINEETGIPYLTKLDESFSMVKFVWNVSRMFWRKELELNEQLTEEEKRIQDHHFLNKIYTIGYLLHRSKRGSRPWAPFAIDMRDGNVGESNGGSGKSILFRLPTYFMKSLTLNGRDPKLLDNGHIFGSVTEDTDYILVDDADQNTDFNFFFPFLTGPFPVNPKHANMFEIPFERSPKIAFTSNHMLRKVDQSVLRRILYVVFSDYYHRKDNKGYYKEERIPSDEFGKDLVVDYTPEEMNQFYNFMLQCCQFYMEYDKKLEPPMESVEKRALRYRMGDSFLEWATVYFSSPDETDVDIKVNKFIHRKETYESFKNDSDNRHVTSKSFKDRLDAYCEYMGWELNPIDVCTDKANRRLVKKNPANNKSEEYLYIRTPDEEKHKKIETFEQNPKIDF